MVRMHWRSVSIGAGLAFALILGMSASPKPIPQGTQEILDHLKIVYLDDGQGGTVKTLRVEGVNLQIVDGSGDTDGATNSAGNLVIGYNEPSDGDFNRTGSHNLAVGIDNDFSSYGGVVACRGGSIEGPGSCVFGGQYNRASNYYSTVCGGEHNSAEGGYSLAAGGSGNNAQGDVAAVFGGEQNVATGAIAVAVGGFGNQSAGKWSVIAGGVRNLASGSGDLIAGGHHNRTTGNGNANIVASARCVANTSNSILGSTSVRVLGANTTVCGGLDLTVEDSSLWIGGGCKECKHAE